MKKAQEKSLISLIHDAIDVYFEQMSGDSKESSYKLSNVLKVAMHDYLDSLSLVKERFGDCKIHTLSLKTPPKDALLSKKLTKKKEKNKWKKKN